MPGLRGPALGAALLGASFALWPAPRVDPPLPPPLDPGQAASERAASEAFDRAVFGRVVGGVNPPSGAIASLDASRAG